MGDLRYNLESGDSYITQYEENPQETGSILADNFEATAERLFGKEYSHDDMEFVLTVFGSNPEPFYEEDADPEELAAAVDAYAKERGGKGWL